MAEKTKDQKTEDKPQQRKGPEQERNETLVRISGYDIPGTRPLYAGLTRVKGVSWAIANALCLSMNLDKRKRVETLTKPEIAAIEAALKKVDVPFFMKNRRSDPESGETVHLLGTDLDMKRDFDIKRMKGMKSYKGIRHSLKLPVRGQRTKSHFRIRGKVTGGKKKANAKKE